MIAIVIVLIAVLAASYLCIKHFEDNDIDF